MIACRPKHLRRLLHYCYPCQRFAFSCHAQKLHLNLVSASNFSIHTGKGDRFFFPSRVYCGSAKSIRCGELNYTEQTTYLSTPCEVKSHVKQVVSNFEQSCHFHRAIHSNVLINFLDKCTKFAGRSSNILAVICHNL